MSILVTLHELVLTHNTDVGHTACHALRNIIVSEIKDFERKVGSLHQKATLVGIYFDVGLGQQMHRVVIEATF